MLDGIRTTKMTAMASSFSQTKFYMKIMIFHFTFSRKTSFSKRKWGSENTRPRYKNHQKSKNIENFDDNVRQTLVNFLKLTQTKYEGNRASIGSGPRISLSRSLFLLLVPLTPDGRGPSGLVHSVEAL